MKMAEVIEAATTPARGVKALLQRQLLGRGDGAPGISTVMVDAFNIVQDRIARSRLAGDPPDTMISLRLQDFGLFDFHRGNDLIESGYAAAARQIEDIAREVEARNAKRGAVGTAQRPVLAVGGQPVAK